MWRPQSSKLSSRLARRCGAPTLRAERRPHAPSICWTCTAVACTLARRTPECAPCKLCRCMAPGAFPGPGSRAQPQLTLHSTPIAKRASTAARLPPACPTVCHPHPLETNHASTTSACTRLSRRLHPTRCVSNHRVHCHPNPLPLFPIASIHPPTHCHPYPLPHFSFQCFRLPTCAHPSIGTSNPPTSSTCLHTPTPTYALPPTTLLPPFPNICRQ